MTEMPERAGEQKAPARADARRPKKPYATPRLTVHGKLTDITKSNMPGSPDDGLVGRCS